MRCPCVVTHDVFGSGRNDHRVRIGFTDRIKSLTARTPRKTGHLYVWSSIKSAEHLSQ